MHYIGIDVSPKESARCILDCSGKSCTRRSSWIQAYAAELERRIQPHLRLSHGFLDRTANAGGL
jgi:hypothetical protein